MTPDTDNASELEPEAPEAAPALMDERMPTEPMSAETLEPDPALGELLARFGSE